MGARPATQALVRRSLERDAEENPSSESVIPTITLAIDPGFLGEGLEGRRLEYHRLLGSQPTMSGRSRTVMIVASMVATRVSRAVGEH